MKTSFLFNPGRPLLLAILALLSGLPYRQANAEVVVVVNARANIEHLSRDEVINIFMGGGRKLPNGTTAHSFDLDADSPLRRAFYYGLIDKSQEEVNAYWARLVFSGRTTPPTPIRGQDEMLEKVMSDPQAVGYIDRKYLGRIDGGGATARNIKIVFALSE